MCSSILVAARSVAIVLTALHWIVATSGVMKELVDSTSCQSCQWTRWRQNSWRCASPESCQSQLYPVDPVRPVQLRYERRSVLQYIGIRRHIAVSLSGAGLQRPRFPLATSFLVARKIRPAIISSIRLLLETSLSTCGFNQGIIWFPFASLLRASCPSVLETLTFHVCGIEACTYIFLVTWAGQLMASGMV